MTTHSIINNEFVPAHKAAILVTDLAVQRGYGIFDFLKTINGKPIFLEDHLNRFFTSAEAMRLPVQQNKAQLKQLLFELIQKNGIANSGVRITLTGGYSADGFQIGEPNLIITQQILQLPATTSQQSSKLITYPYLRQFSGAKTLDYVMAVWLQPVIKERGADDVLYHHNNTITECPRANFFIVNKEGKLMTTKNNVLKGVIRKQVLEIATNNGLLADDDITLTDLLNCKEAFVTSTTKNILPVVAIDGKAIGNGQTGPVTQQLAEQLESRIQQYLHRALMV